MAKIFQLDRLRAGFTQKGKLAWECNPIKAQMGSESSASDLLTMHKIKKSTADDNKVHLIY